MGSTVLRKKARAKRRKGTKQKQVTTRADIIFAGAQTRSRLIPRFGDRDKHAAWQQKEDPGPSRGPPRDSDSSDFLGGSSRGILREGRGWWGGAHVPPSKVQASELDSLGVSTPRLARAYRRAYWPTSYRCSTLRSSSIATLMVLGARLLRLGPSISDGLISASFTIPDAASAIR